MIFGELQKMTGRAMYISQRLDLKAFEKNRQLAQTVRSSSVPATRAQPSCSVTA